MTDIVERIVERLREGGSDAREGADEIERLRDKVALWRERYEAERAAHEATIKHANKMMQGEP